MGSTSTIQFEVYTLTALNKCQKSWPVAQVVGVHSPFERCSSQYCPLAQIWDRKESVALALAVFSA